MYKQIDCRLVIHILYPLEINALLLYIVAITIRYTISCFCYLFFLLYAAVLRILPVSEDDYQLYREMAMKKI